MQTPAPKMGGYSASRMIRASMFAAEIWIENEFICAWTNAASWIIEPEVSIAKMMSEQNVPIAAELIWGLPGDNLADFEANLDDLVFYEIDLLFVDGFESGDTTAWPP